MANSSDLLTNEYMVFEPDQVLTNYHLNQLFYYLDQQNRWTRNKLIGIGIVCGFDIEQTSEAIEVTKGCGITSQGYLITQDDKQYTYYMPYAGIDEPNDLPFDYPGDLPFFKQYNAGKTIFSLLTDDDFTALDNDTKPQAQKLGDAFANKLFATSVVVLFLEAAELDLKNCDTFDCDDKGEKILMNIRCLMLDQKFLPGKQTGDSNLPKFNFSKIAFPPPRFTAKDSLVGSFGKTSSFAAEKMRAASLKTGFASSKFATASSLGNISALGGASIGSVLSPGNISLGGIFTKPLFTFNFGAPDINLKRFNVPYTALQSADDIINAFTKLTDDATLTSIVNAYNYCYDHHKDLLNVTDNPFINMLSNLQQQRDIILKSFPTFIQYFYDFLDDLTKAYYEFRDKASQLLYACCPDENMFPLHLVLGEAAGIRQEFTKDNYRTYFIYSPLFARQENEISEAVFLITRMQIMAGEFNLVLANNLRLFAIRITPSLFQQAYLSDRAIPYYYNLDEIDKELYRYWSYNKTIHGRSTYNLSYNANEYSSNPAVLDPLIYDIEKYDFFRIEGHIGINYQTALTNIIQQRNNYNLPFDVVAISADKLPGGTGTVPDCNVQDLDTDYKLLVSEFACKVHTPFCFLTKLPYPPQTDTTGGVFTGGSVIKGEAVENISNAGLQNIKNSEKKLADANTQKIVSGAERLSNTANANINFTAQPLSFNQFKFQGINPGDINLNFPVLQLAYRKGDFMRKYCAPIANTMGSAYLTAISSGVFKNPVQLNTNNSVFIQYFYFFEYIDAVESLMQVLTPSTLENIDMTAFAAAYKRFTDLLGIITFSVTEFMNDKFGNSDSTALQFFKDIEMNIFVDEFSTPAYACIDERLQTLQDEYKSRLRLYELQRSFYYYYDKHRGLEHKAGVPKGGTFVLVYHTVQQTNAGVGNLTGIGNIGLANAGSNIGLANSGIFSNLQTQKNNPQFSSNVSGAKLFMARKPKITLDKNASKNIKAAADKTKDADTKNPAEQPDTSADKLKTGATGSIKQIKPAAKTTGQPETKREDAAGAVTGKLPGTGDVVKNAGQPDITKETITGQASGSVGSVKNTDSSAQLKDAALSASVQNLSGTQLASTGLLDENTVNLFKDFATTSSDVSAENKLTILDFLNKAQLQFAPTKFAIGDNVVIADFYVPYLCCSDCAPVAYIVQPPAVTIEFSITPNEFVFDDTTNYPFTAEPPVTDAGAKDPFTSADIVNKDNVHLLTDAANILYLQPAMSQLPKTLQTIVVYKGLPASITIIKPDAAFKINEVVDANGNLFLQLVPADMNADSYVWSVNNMDNIFENKNNPAPVSIKNLTDKTDSDSFDIMLKLSYTRNVKTSADSKMLNYTLQTEAVCIDFEDPPFKLNTVYGPQVGQKDGDTIFTTNNKVIAKIHPLQLAQTSTFGVAMVLNSPFSDGQAMSVNNINIEFDYTKSGRLPMQVTVDFFDQGGTENLSVNGSKFFIGELSKPPAELGGVNISVVMSTGNNIRQGILTLSSKDGAGIKTFIIGGQEFFIDNICAQ